MTKNEAHKEKNSCFAYRQEGEHVLQMMEHVSVAGASCFFVELRGENGLSKVQIHEQLLHGCVEVARGAQVREAHCGTTLQPEWSFGPVIPNHVSRSMA